jgi:hypothetical protein
MVLINRNRKRKTANGKAKTQFVAVQDGIMTKNPGIKEGYYQAPAGLKRNRGGTLRQIFWLGGTPRAANCLRLINKGGLNQVKIPFFIKKRPNLLKIPDYGRRGGLQQLSIRNDR